MGSSDEQVMETTIINRRSGPGQLRKWYHDIHRSGITTTTQELGSACLSKEEDNVRSHQYNKSTEKHSSFADSIMPQFLLRVCRAFSWASCWPHIRLDPLNESFARCAVTREKPSLHHVSFDKCHIRYRRNFLQYEAIFSTLRLSKSRGLSKSDNSPEYMTYSLPVGSSCAGKRSPPHIVHTETAVTSPAKPVHHECLRRKTTKQ